MADVEKLEENINQIIELKKQKAKASAYARRQIREWTDKKAEKEKEFDDKIAALESECAGIVQAEQTSYQNEAGNVRITFIKDSEKQVWNTAALNDFAKNSRSKIRQPEFKKTIALKGGVRFKYM